MEKHTEENSPNKANVDELGLSSAGHVVPDETESESAVKKNPAAVALGRLGGLKGGKARAAKLSAQQRQEIARKAAEARWRKKDKSESPDVTSDA
jgi:hypothetical protein